MMIGVSWQIRPFAAATDRAWVGQLWQAAMPPFWPVLPAGIGQLGEGLVAQAGPLPAGFVAFDRDGGIPLILVQPGYQRHGIGTALLEAALQQLRAGSAADVTAGSGGAGYIWPGVPRDLPAAVAFFASRGWRHTHDTLDLVTDLTGYRAPPGAAARAVRTGATITQAAAGDLAAVRVRGGCLPQLGALVRRGPPGAHPARPDPYRGGRRDCDPSSGRDARNAADMVAEPSAGKGAVCCARMGDMRVLSVPTARERSRFASW
jgi:GNAT superfamily N-acetyltransferase